MSDIKPNDVVMLKSCGPPMTVTKIDNGIANCVWFKLVNEDSWEGPYLHQFPIKTLEILESNDKDATKFN